jgi:hypothetical protein
MVHLFAATTAAVVFALGAVASPVAAPVAAQTASPDASPLPEIGRVRSTAPACAALRDLVIPSFSAAQRADARFVQTRARLPQYADVAADPWHKNSVFRDSALAKLDADATALLNEALWLDKALRDPRLKDTTDPQVVAERMGLQQLYDVQKARANQLQEFVMRERNATVRNGMEDSGAFGGKNQPLPVSGDEQPPMSPPPPLNVPRGMPILTGKSALADKASLSEWSLNMAAAVRLGENQAAKAFLPIAKSCN